MKRHIIWNLTCVSHICYKYSHLFVTLNILKFYLKNTCWFNPKFLQKPGLSQPKLGVRNSACVIHMSGRDTTAWNNACCLLGHTWAGSWKWKRSWSLKPGAMTWDRCLHRYARTPHPWLPHQFLKTVLSQNYAYFYGIKFIIFNRRFLHREIPIQIINKYTQDFWFYAFKFYVLVFFFIQTVFIEW